MSECRLLEEKTGDAISCPGDSTGSKAARNCTCNRCAPWPILISTTLGAYSYEQALLIIRQLNLPMETVEEQFRRMAFNIIATNVMTTSRTSRF